MYGGQPVYHNHPVAHPSHLPPMHNHPPNASNTSGGHHSNSTSQSSLAQHSHPPSSPPNSRRSVESEQSFRAHQVHHQVRSPLLMKVGSVGEFFPFIQVQQAARLPVLSEGDPGEDEPLIPPRTSSRPAAVIVPAQQQQPPPLHHQHHPLAMNNSRFGTPPRSLLAMDVTQRMSQTPLQRHQLQHQMSEPVFSGPPEEPPPPAPSGASAGGMVAPLPSHVNQRRVVEAVVRTNPRLRHQHSHPAPHHAHAQQQVPQYQMPFYHHQRATLQEIMQQRQQQMQLQQQQQQQHRHHQHPMQRFHSEESLASRGGVYDGHHGGLYSSRIHSSADEISSLNRSPSITSDDDQARDSVRHRKYTSKSRIFHKDIIYQQQVVHDHTGHTLLFIPIKLDCAPAYFGIFFGNELNALPEPRRRRRGGRWRSVRGARRRRRHLRRRPALEAAQPRAVDVPL